MDHTTIALSLRYNHGYTENELLHVILNAAFTDSPVHYQGLKLIQYKRVRGQKCKQMLQRMIDGSYIVQRADGRYNRPTQNRTMQHFIWPADNTVHSCPVDEYPAYIARLRGATPDALRDARIADLERQLHELKES